MIFPTKVHGMPCQCHVLSYSPRVWATYTDPGELEDFEYELIDSKGRRAYWLDRYDSSVVATRLLEEYLIMLQGEINEQLITEAMY